MQDCHCHIQVLEVQEHGVIWIQVRSSVCSLVFSVFSWLHQGCDFSWLSYAGLYSATISLAYVPTNRWACVWTGKTSILLYCFSHNNCTQGEGGAGCLLHDVSCSITQRLKCQNVISVGHIAMKYYKHICAPQRINQINFPLVAPPSGQNVQTTFFNHFRSLIIHYPTDAVANHQPGTKISCSY